MNDSTLTYHSVALFVESIQTSKRFYTSLLNREIELDFGKNVILKGGITLWQISGSHIISERLGRERLSGNSNRCELYFETEEIEAFCQKLEKSNVRFLHTVHQEPWGQKTIRFFDPDDHLIEAGEPLHIFIRRLHDQGLTAVKIAARTSVPVEKIREITG